MKIKELLACVQPVWKPNPRTGNIAPMVTIILPTFRRAKSGHFERAVESVIRQSFQDWELIIVDDASTDGTKDLINFYMTLDSRIHTIRHTFNLGLPAVSEYEGYTKARGQYIAFIFDDNEWDQDHLMLSIKSMVKSNVKFTFGITRLYDKNNSTFDIDYPLVYLPISNPIGNGSVVIHKDIIEDVGLYDPHLSLTRLCDWDLWRRICYKYLIHKSNKVSTNEYGLALKDSLGNTVDLNDWISLEQMSYVRDEALRPANMPEYDILGTHDNSTDIFVSFLDSIYNTKYKNKKWYRPVYLTSSTQTAPKKRILVVAASIDATYYLSFDALFSEAIFKIRLFSNITSRDFEFADAIIFIRDINAAIELIDKYDLAGYETFYYFDDNFFELVKDVKHVSSNIRSSYLSVVNKLNRKTLTHYFNKIIVSTEALQDFCTSKGIHKDIQLLPPCSRICTDLTQTPPSDTVRIAFIGGSFREKIFLNTVFPAIEKLSVSHEVELVCPESLADTINEFGKLPEKLTITGIERNFCFPQIIQLYRQKKIHILVHPGEKIINNKYKTLNSLINAVTLGAVLVTSDVDPYIGCDAIVPCHNDPDSWAKALIRISDDTNERNRLFQIASKLVNEKYSIDAVSRKFQDIISSVRTMSYSEIIQRYEKLLCNIPKMNAQTTGSISEIVKNTRWDPDSLVFSGGIAERRRYTITSTATNSHKIGMIFTSMSDSPCRGEIICRIYGHNNIVISESTMDMDSIINNSWCYFTTGDMIIPEKFTLELEFKYQPGSGLLGIYEIRANRTFAYKVAKKLKLPYYGINVPLIDISILD